MSKNEQKVANESTQIKVNLNEKEEIHEDALDKLNSYLNMLSVDLRIGVDGVVTEIKPKDEKEGYNIKEMYKMCNTDIVEFIFLPADKILVVDEEGALKRDKKINWDATKFVAPLILAQGGNPFFIFGNVMLVARKNVQ